MEIESLAAGTLDHLALGIGRVEADELVDGLAVPDRSRKRRQQHRILQGTRVLLREWRHRDLRGELVRCDGDVLFLGDRVEHQHGLRALLGGGPPFLTQLGLGLARLQQELLEADPLLAHA